MDLSTKSVGNSSIRRSNAQRLGVDMGFLIHQALSVHMPGLNTLLSTKSVHKAKGWMDVSLACPRRCLNTKRTDGADPLKSRLWPYLPVCVAAHDKLFIINDLH